MLPLELRSVRVAYGDQLALDGVSLSVSAGECVAVVGPSGAGKSSLLGLCNATVTPTGGEVLFNGSPVRDSERWRRDDGRRVATIYQHLHLIDKLQVVHNVNAGRLGEWSTLRSLWSLVSPREVSETRAVLDRLGIADKLHHRTGDLSGGEQQRVAIARALRQDPLLILADEPTASLDPARAEEIMVVLTAVARERRRALIVSQHDINLAIRTCDRIVGLRSGRVVFDTDARSVTRDMADTLYRTAGSNTRSTLR